MSYQERIARKLQQFEKALQAAKRENRQGWSITQDLRKLRTYLDELENLDLLDRRSRSAED